MSSRRAARLALELMRDQRKAQARIARLPALTPETWPQRYCECGTCDVCRHLASSVELREAPALERDEYRWPSLRSALLLWEAARRDGYPVGSLGGALHALAELGSWTATGRCEQPAAQRLAGDVADVERSLRLIPGTFHLSAEAHVDVLVARIVGAPTAVRTRGGVVQRPWLPVPELVLAGRHCVGVSVVRAAVRRAAKIVRVDLVRRGLLSPKLPRNGP